MHTEWKTGHTFLVFTGEGVVYDIGSCHEASIPIRVQYALLAASGRPLSGAVLAISVTAAGLAGS